MRRRLDAELVRRGLVASRARATQVIGAGRVLVGGAPADSPSRQVSPSESITVTAAPPPYVSRGGEKLAGALDRFTVTATGRRALDVGAGHGGFTDCLLRAGAANVVAVDVGHGQFDWALRTDPRVTVLERKNARTLEDHEIGGAVDLVVADVAFISLLTVAPALYRCTKPRADLLLLVKPQFEAGRRAVGKGGIVRDPTVHTSVLRDVSAGLAAAGLPAGAVVPSPLRGADGNVEFFLHCRRRAGAASGLGDRAIDAAVDEAHAAVPT